MECHSFAFKSFELTSSSQKVFVTGALYSFFRNVVIIATDNDNSFFRNFVIIATDNENISKKGVITKFLKRSTVGSTVALTLNSFGR